MITPGLQFMEKIVLYIPNYKITIVTLSYNTCSIACPFYGSLVKLINLSITTVEARSLIRGAVMLDQKQSSKVQDFTLTEREDNFKSFRHISCFSVVHEEMKPHGKKYCTHDYGGTLLILCK